jgi:hypothetical protein
MRVSDVPDVDASLEAVCCEAVGQTSTEPGRAVVPGLRRWEVVEDVGTVPRRSASRVAVKFDSRVRVEDRDRPCLKVVLRPVGNPGS